MDHHYNKLESELFELSSHYESLCESWSKPSDYEDLFRMRIPLLIVATLLRVIGKHKNSNIEILKDIKNHQNPRELMYSFSEVSSLIYPDDFRNKVKAQLSLEEVCNYLIHEKGSVYLDNRNELDQKEGFQIYYSVYTDKKEEIAINIEHFIQIAEDVLSSRD